MLVFDKRRPNTPLLIYERSHGKFVVRPWSAPDQFITLCNRIAEKGVKNINLVLGGNMNSRGRTERPWSDWLTDAQRRELRDIGVDV